MGFKTCLKKILRTPLKSFLFLLLLTTSGILLGLGLSLFITANDTVKNANKMFTTIAVPNIKNMWKDSHNYSRDVDIRAKFDGDLWGINWQKSLIGTSKLYYQVLEDCLKSEIANIDLRKSYLASSDDLNPVLYSGDKYHSELSLYYKIAVLDVICEDIKFDYYDSEVTYNFKVNDALVIHPSYEVPKTIRIEYELENKENIEIGKRYLVSGGHNFKNNDGKITSVLFSNSFWPYLGDKSFDYIKNEEVRIIEADISKFIEVNEDINVLLNRSENIEYKKMVDNLDFISKSAYIISTNNINSVFHFNQKKARIIDGREISSIEYEQGEKVCLISSEYAQFNDLKVEDEIRLSFSDAKYYTCDYYQYTVEPVWFLNLNPFYISKSNEQTFKVVGIYKAPKWSYNSDYFTISSNTIFVPTKSVDMSEISHSIVGKSNDIETYDHVPPNLFSIIIPNDRIEEFKAEMEDKGVGRYLLYYDQGYSSVKGVLKTLYQNSIIILEICVIAWILVLVLFILLYILKEKKDAGIMLSLGLGAKKTFIQLILSCILLTLPSTITGAIISNSLEAKVTDLSYEMAVNQSAFDESFSDNTGRGYEFLNNQREKGSNSEESIITSSNLALIATFIQFILIISVSSICIYFLLRKNPMELAKSKD